MAPSPPSNSTRWRYELIDRAYGEVELSSLLRRKYKRKSPFKRRSAAGVHLMPKRVASAQRPPVVDTRETVGHWEADPVLGAHHQGALVTVVERNTRQLVSRAVARRRNTAGADAIIETFETLRKGSSRSRSTTAANAPITNGARQS